MGMYYNDVKDVTGFTEESLKEDIRSVFDCGIAASVAFGIRSELNDAKNKCLTELFAHMLERNFPNLDELKSNGALQEYVRLLRERKQ